MPLISWWKESKAIGGRGRENLRISKIKCNSWEYWTFRLTAETLKQAGLEHGSYVDILVDPETGEGRIERSERGGWKVQVLSPRNRTAYIRISTRYGFGIKGKLPVCCPVETEPGAVKFQLPK